MRANSSDLAEISLRQRILRNVDNLSLEDHAIRPGTGHAGDPRAPWA